MAEQNFHPLLVDSSPDDFEDSEVQKIKQKRQAAIWDITRQLAGITYTGTGTKQEMIELEENMRSLLESGLYGYKFIENCLLSIGYNLNKIRQTFRKLTGMDPQVYLDAQPFLDTPGTIPGINYGWGKSKDKQYDYYFIMPYKSGFSVFGQKGDLLREEVKYFLTLDEAQDFLKRKTVDFQYYDKIVPPDKLKPRNWQQLSEVLPIGTKIANRAIEYLDKFNDLLQPQEKRAILENELAQKNITPSEFNKLAIKYGVIKEAAPDIEQVSEEGGPDIEKIITEEVFKEEKKIMEQPLEEELEERTPQQFFEKQKEAPKSAVVSDVINSIMDYIYELNESLHEFRVDVKSFKYAFKEITERIERTPEVGTEKAEEFFSSSGVISVLIDIVDLTLPSSVNIKQGLTVFSVIGNDVVTSGTFKGVDNQIYSLDEAGFEKYFITDRQKYHNM